MELFLISIIINDYIKFNQTHKFLENEYRFDIVLEILKQRRLKHHINLNYLF